MSQPRGPRGHHDDEVAPPESPTPRGSGAGDWAPLAAGVRAAFVRAATSGESADEVATWERRRRRRCVRLWVVSLGVRARARDALEARYRLARYVRRPCHRTGSVRALCATGDPAPCATGDPAPCADGRWPAVATYPREAVARSHDRAPYGALERAHVAGYVRALVTARCRVLGLRPYTERPGAVGADPAGGAATPHSSLPPGVGGGSEWWRVVHRLLFLAGPGQAPARAAELAATVVDDQGDPVGEVLALRADDGYPNADGQWVHPALSVTAEALTALWDDYDLAEDDPGEPAALARVLGTAATRVWDDFSADTDDHFGERNGR